MSMKQPNPETEGILTPKSSSTPDRFGKYVGAYFSQDSGFDLEQLTSSDQQEVIRLIKERREVIRRLESHPKVTEYVQAILAGIRINLDEFTDNIRYAVQYAVADMREKRTRENSEAVRGVDGGEVSKLYDMVPPQYRDLPAEIIEDMWIEPITVDDPTMGRAFKARKAYILEHITKDQQKKRHQNSIDVVKERLAASANGATTAPEAAPVETPAISPEETSKTPEKNLEIELKQTIELDETIPRASVQEVFGDSNGSYTGFVEHLQSRGLVEVDDNGEIVWTGGNTRATFLGDILGDRVAGGIQIYKQLTRLKKAAQKSGGDVTWVTGNHDNMFNSALFGFTSEFGMKSEDDFLKRTISYVGNLETARYLSDDVIKAYFDNDVVAQSIRDILQGNSVLHKDIEKKRRTHDDLLRFNPGDVKVAEIAANYLSSISEIEKSLRDFATVFQDPAKSPRDKMEAFLGLGGNLSQPVLSKLGRDILDNRESLLNNIRTEDQEFLEGIYQQTLVTIKDDVLCCHTNFTKNMITLIEGQIKPGEDFKKGVENLNKFYQDTLRWYGSPEPRNPAALPDANVKYFNTIRDEFISTSKASRINYAENDKITPQEKAQITARLKKYGINIVLHGHNDEDGRAKGTAELPILSLDRSTYKGSEGVLNKPIAVASVSTKGKVSYY